MDRVEDALVRIAQALEDFLAITLSTQQSVIAGKVMEDEELEPIFRPLLETMERIAARRAKEETDATDHDS